MSAWLPARGRAHVHECPRSRDLVHARAPAQRPDGRTGGWEGPGAEPPAARGGGAAGARDFDAPVAGQHPRQTYLRGEARSLAWTRSLKIYHYYYY